MREFTNTNSKNLVMAGFVPAIHNLSLAGWTLEYGWPPQGRP